MRKKFNLLITILIMATTMLVGCGSKSNNAIIGKWTITNFESQNSNNALAELQLQLMKMVFNLGSIIEFMDTNKVSVMMNSTDYKWIDKDTIQIGSDNGSDTPIVFDVEINSDTMTFTNPMVIISLSKGVVSIPSDKQNDSKSEETDNNDQYQNLQTRFDELTTENQMLTEELDRYKSIVDARELLSIDAEIDDKFSNSYGIDESPVIHGLQFTVNEIGEGKDYNGKAPEQGELVYVNFSFKNTSIENQNLGGYTMSLIERDGTQYKPHFQFNDREDKEVVNNHDYLARIYWDSSKYSLSPKFSDDGVVVFNVAQLSGEYLLEIKNYNNNDIAYIRIK